MRRIDRMIVAVGLDVDRPFAAFVATARKLGVDVEALNLRAAVEGEWCVPLPANEPSRFWYGGRTLVLQPSDSYYCRIIDLSPRAVRTRFRLSLDRPDRCPACLA